MSEKFRGQVEGHVGGASIFEQIHRGENIFDFLCFFFLFLFFLSSLVILLRIFLLEVEFGYRS